MTKYLCYIISESQDHKRRELQRQTPRIQAPETDLSLKLTTIYSVFELGQLISDFASVQCGYWQQLCHRALEYVWKDDLCKATAQHRDPYVNSGVISEVLWETGTKIHVSGQRPTGGQSGDSNSCREVKGRRETAAELWQGCRGFPRELWSCGDPSEMPPTEARGQASYLRIRPVITCGLSREEGNSCKQVCSVSQGPFLERLGCQPRQATLQQLEEGRPPSRRGCVSGMHPAATTAHLCVTQGHFLHVISGPQLNKGLAES